MEPGSALVSAEVLGSALLGPIDDPATARWARAQLRLTTLASAVSAIRAVCEFSSDRWIGQVDVPAAVVVTTRDRIVPVSRHLQLAQAIPGAALHRVDADHAVCITAPQVFAPMLLEACQAVQASSSQLTSDSAWPTLTMRGSRPAWSGCWQNSGTKGQNGPIFIGRRVDQAMAATGLTGHRLAPRQAPRLG